MGASRWGGSELELRAGSQQAWRGSKEGLGVKCLPPLPVLALQLVGLANV